LIRLNKELIINATPQGVEIALLEDKKLVELHHEKADASFAVGDLYLGKVKKLIPGLNAAFVDVGFEKKQFRVQVRDDGRGFDTAMASSQPNGHYGLVGIQERTKRIGGELILNSWPGSGTELTLSVPRRAPATESGVPRI